MTHRFWSMVELLAVVAVGVTVLVLALFAFVTHDALCSFKSDLDQRTLTAERLLTENQGPVIEVFGLEIPRDELEREYLSRKRALDSLDGLYCW